MRAYIELIIVLMVYGQIMYTMGHRQDEWVGWVLRQVDRVIAIGIAREEDRVPNWKEIPLICSICDKPAIGGMADASELWCSNHAPMFMYWSEDAAKTFHLNPWSELVHLRAKVESLQAEVARLDDGLNRRGR